MSKLLEVNLQDRISSPISRPIFTMKDIFILYLSYINIKKEAWVKFKNILVFLKSSVSILEAVNFFFPPVFFTGDATFNKVSESLLSGIPL